MRKVVLAALVVACTALVVAPTGLAAKPGNSVNAKLCQKGGWKSWYRSNGTPFKNQGGCVSYAARGGSLVRSATADISLSYSNQTLTVTNAGPLAATVTVAYFRCGGSGLGAAAGWDIAFSTQYFTFTSQNPIPAGQSLTVVVVSYFCATYAQVTASSQPDPDSTPNNLVTTEDDYVVIPQAIP